MKHKTKYIKVAVKLSLDMFFTYSVPSHIKLRLEPGFRVIVPFGGRIIMGVVMECLASLPNSSEKDKPPIDLKPIIDVVDTEPLYTRKMFELLVWVSEYYIDSLPNVIRSVVSSKRAVDVDMLTVLKHTSVSLLPDVLAKLERPHCMLLMLLYKYGPMTVSRVKSFLSTEGFERRAILFLKDLGLLKIVSLKERDDTVTRKLYLRLAPGFDLKSDWEDRFRHAPVQLKILKFIIHRKTPVLKEELKSLFSNCDASLRALIQKSAVVEGASEELSDFESAELLNNAFTKPILTEAQSKAWSTLERFVSKGSFNVVNIYGVTGSGKTELYCLFIEELLKKSKGVIYLVPEISLTPQLINTLNERFSGSVAVIHSHMGARRRKEDLDDIFKGKKKVVVGVRSAVFAPVENLGGIIVDEEHEASYKQGKNPRYNARDVAIMRGKIYGIPVILGSATPSVETMWNVEHGKYSQVIMRERVDSSSLPFVELIDMRGLASLNAILDSENPRLQLDEALDKLDNCEVEAKENNTENKIFISDRLFDEINLRLEKKEVSLLFLNQRGFAPVVLCEQCGFSFDCPNCSVSLTYHHTQKRALCHYCSYSLYVGSGCPSCRGNFIEFHGQGTQRIEEKLKELFPNARVLRMDSDSMSRKGSYQEAYAAIKNGDIDIIVGTQMIAKGIHFPSITLVGVINADLSLRFPDFRAAERTFQVLAQVAGRAGRGENVGEVIVQAYTPEHYSIISAIKQDYDLFYSQEVELRKKMGYPPFFRMINIIVSGGDKQDVVRVTNILFEALCEPSKRENVFLIGPYWAALSRVKGRHRRQILMKSKTHQAMKSLITRTLNNIDQKLRHGDIYITVDVDPINLM